MSVSKRESRFQSLSQKLHCESISSCIFVQRPSPKHDVILNPATQSFVSSLYPLDLRDLYIDFDRNLDVVKVHLRRIIGEWLFE